MPQYRATQTALKQIQGGGEIALDFIGEFERNGVRQFTTVLGVTVEISASEDFLCVHLPGECAQQATCPRRLCGKLKNGG